MSTIIPSSLHPHDSRLNICMCIIFGFKIMVWFFLFFLCFSMWNTCDNRVIGCLLHYRAENYNTSAVEFMRRLPGVSDSNYRAIMDGCESLAELALLPLEKLAELMGSQKAAKTLREFLDAKYPTLLWGQLVSLHPTHKKCFTLSLDKVVA